MTELIVNDVVAIMARRTKALEALPRHLDLECMLDPEYLAQVGGIEISFPALDNLNGSSGDTNGSYNQMEYVKDFAKRAGLLSEFELYQEERHPHQCFKVHDIALHKLMIALFKQGIETVNIDILEEITRKYSRYFRATPMGLVRGILNHDTDTQAYFLEYATQIRYPGLPLSYWGEPPVSLYYTPNKPLVVDGAIKATTSRIYENVPTFHILGYQYVFVEAWGDQNNIYLKTNTGDVRVCSNQDFNENVIMGMGSFEQSFGKELGAALDRGQWKMALSICSNMGIIKLGINDKAIRGKEDAFMRKILKIYAPNTLNEFEEWLASGQTVGI